MRLPNLTARHAAPDATLAQLSEQPFPTSDQVLLCSFPDDLAGERTVQELRDSLLAAGFAARETRHLIRICPVLRRSSKGRYQLKPLSADRRPAGRTPTWTALRVTRFISVPFLIRSTALKGTAASHQQNETSSPQDGSGGD